MPLAHIANLWTLTQHPSAAKEWSLEKKIKAIAAAGFDGITTRLTPAHRTVAEANGLGHLVGFFSSSDPTEFDTLLRAQKESGANHLNVQLDDDDTPPALATKHWLQFKTRSSFIFDRLTVIMPRCPGLIAAS